LKKISFLKFSASLLIAIVLFYFAFRRVDLSEFFSKAAHVNYGWVGASILIAMGSHWLRAFRWNLMLRPLGFQVTQFHTFVAVMTGYLANLAFPRLGEVTRCGVLKKNDGVPVSIGFGTVITERMIDVLILASLIFADFVIEFDKVYEYFMGVLNFGRFGDLRLLFLGFGLAIFTGILMTVWFFRKMNSMDFTNPYLQKVKKFIIEMRDGLFVLKKLENLPGFIISTIGIWTAYYMMSYVIFFAIDDTDSLGFGAGLSVLAAASVAMVIPVQGGIGAYHFLVSGVLVLYGIESTTGLFFATLLHTSQVIFVLIFGGLSVLATVFISRQKKRQEQKPLTD